MCTRLTRLKLSLGAIPPNGAANAPALFNMAALKKVQDLYLDKVNESPTHGVVYMSTPRGVLSCLSHITRLSLTTVMLRICTL